MIEATKFILHHVIIFVPIKKYIYAINIDELEAGKKLALQSCGNKQQQQMFVGLTITVHQTVVRKVCDQRGDIHTELGIFMHFLSNRFDLYFSLLNQWLQPEKGKIKIVNIYLLICVWLDVEMHVFFFFFSIKVMVSIVCLLGLSPKSLGSFSFR